MLRFAIIKSRKDTNGTIVTSLSPKHVLRSLVNKTLDGFNVDDFISDVIIRATKLYPTGRLTTKKKKEKIEKILLVVMTEAIKEMDVEKRISSNIEKAFSHTIKEVKMRTQTLS